MNPSMIRTGAIVLLSWLCTLTVVAREPAPGWPDTPLSRTQALAELQALNADLLSHPSATLTLERWCGAHHLAAEAKIVAHRVQGADKPLPEGARAQLGIGPDEPVRYRRVQLACGDVVLSDADNWYVPARLTPAMNRTLDTTATPFGTVVRPLNFHRQTVGTSQSNHGDVVLQVKAVLLTPQEAPISLVVENYSGVLLGTQ